MATLKDVIASLGISNQEFPSLAVGMMQAPAQQELRVTELYTRVLNLQSLLQSINANPGLAQIILDPVLQEIVKLEQEVKNTAEFFTEFSSKITAVLGPDVELYSSMLDHLGKQYEVLTPKQDALFTKIHGVFKTTCNFYQLTIEHSPSSEASSSMAARSISSFNPSSSLSIDNTLPLPTEGFTESVCSVDFTATFQLLQQRRAEGLARQPLPQVTLSSRSPSPETDAPAALIQASLSSPTRLGEEDSSSSSTPSSEPVAESVDEASAPASSTTEQAHSGFTLTYETDLEGDGFQPALDEPSMFENSILDSSVIGLDSSVIGPSNSASEVEINALRLFVTEHKNAAQKSRESNRNYTAGVLKQMKKIPSVDRTRVYKNFETVFVEMTKMELPKDRNQRGIWVRSTYAKPEHCAILEEALNRFLK